MATELDIDYINYLSVTHRLTKNVAAPLAENITSGIFREEYENSSYGFRELISNNLYDAVNSKIRHKVFMPAYAKYKTINF